MSLLAGVDGCPGHRWVAVIRLADDWKAEWFAEFGDWISSFAGVVAVDIPIGLPDRSRRECDGLVRAELGVRGSAVFGVPVREALWAPDYSASLEIQRARVGVGFSLQTWGLVPRIRQVDAALRGTVGLRRRVVESHPELAFARLAGGPLPPKKSLDGLVARREAVDRAWPGAWERLRPQVAPGKVPDVDLLDALVLVGVAERFAAGRAESLPAVAPLDAAGLPMRIVV